MSASDKSGEQFLRTDEPRECPACWGNGYTAGEADKVPCGICAETGRVIPYFAPSAELPPVAPVAEEITKALRELADGYMRDSMGEKQELTIYGRTMREAIVAQALARLSAKSATSAHIPDVLFDSYTVYKELRSAEASGISISAEAVAEVLDAAVRLLRRSEGRDA